MGNKIYQVFSPDGFAISQDVYYTPEEQKEAFNSWKQRFENQGFYSSNNGRIPLSELKKYCQFKTFDKNDIESKSDIKLFYNAR